MSVKCRVCTSKTHPFLIFPTDQLDEPFLDPTLRRELPELRLARCTNCGCIWATDARRCETVLRKAYERLPVSYFDEFVPSRYHKFYKWLACLLEENQTGRKILDVGCGDGSFLSSLSDRWTKRGLEPSHAGLELSKRKDLDVARGTLESVSDIKQVDLISALDVIEHLIDPHNFIVSIKKTLKSNGMVLLFTGDSTSRAARIAGPQWSYLRWCGHVSVFSASGLKLLLESHGFEIVVWKRCEHPCSSGCTAWCRVYLLEPIRRLLKRRESWYPFWKDHQLVIARLK